MLKLKGFLRIPKTAESLDVSPNPLRNWESAGKWESVGKIVATRHPVNDDPRFRTEDLDLLLQKMERPPRQRKAK